MKQTEKRMKTGIVIVCELTLREKIRVLFSKNFVVGVDLFIDSDDGIVESEKPLFTGK